MKIIRVRKPKKGRIEIIPMIDVMFFLLATFMLASLAMQKLNALPVDLPKGVAQNIQIDKKITLSIDKNNLVYLDNVAIPINQIGEKILPLIKPNLSDNVVINADKLSSHGVVVEVMLKAKQVGAQHFSIVVKDE